ncbi:MAG: ABC transporter substrate-binding protein [Candidatus Velthaea sp.]
MKTRWWSWLTAVAVFASTLGAAPHERGTFIVGLLNPSTGPFTALGADVNSGFNYYLQQRGGVLGGYRIDVRIGDEANSVDAALARAHQFIEQDHVNAIVGLVNSAVAYGIASYVEAQKTPLLITVAGADGLTQARANPWMFRVSYTGSQDSMPMGDYACKRMQKKTAVAIGLDYAFGWEATGGFARAYTDSGCKIVQEIYAPLGTQDWAPFVQRIDKSASVVYITSAGADSVRFLAAYHDFGLTAPIVGQGALTDEALLPAEGKYAEGVITTLHYSAALPSERNREFRRGYEAATHKIVSQYVEDGYAAAQMLEAALKKLPGNAVTADAFAAALRTARVDAPRGPLRFDSKQQAVYNVYVRQVKRGKNGLENALLTTYLDVTQFWHYDAASYLAGEPYAKRKGSWAKP